jgi:hypothetical protein
MGIRQVERTTRANMAAHCSLCMIYLRRLDSTAMAFSDGLIVLLDFGVYGMGI